VTVILSAVLPPGDRNGLAAIADALVDDSINLGQMVVAMVNCKKITTTTLGDSRKVVATAQILEIEAFPGGTEGWHVLHKILQRQREDRTGEVPLPLEDDPE
jgi:hypothetical protein